MKKPASLFNRGDDWDALARYASDERRGTQLAVVRGRRRTGKSVLLRALAAAAGGFYHQAVEGTPADQLRLLGEDYALARRLPAPVAFADSDAALRALLDDDAGPRLIVLDECSYLIDADPSLPSRLQRALDQRRRHGPAKRLILCGSALSVMAGLLVGSAPLRGRASVELPIHPFTHRDAAAFQRLRDPRLAFRVFALLGGVAGYTADLLGGDLPARLADFDRWVSETVLSPRRPLLYEARHLLDEPGVRDRALYLSVLAAVGEGATTNGQVASRLARPTSAVVAPLHLLADLRLVRRRDDPLRRRRPTWVVADPLVRLWSVILRRNWPALEQGRASTVWAAAQSAWQAQILGPAFEELARDWAATQTVALGPVGSVGAAVVADPRRRVRHEVDVVALDAVGRHVAVLGEAKLARLGVADLRRLQEIRALLVARGDADDSTKIVLFSLAGFTRDLQRAAGRDVELVDAARLYAP
jgi:hypothetical protein